MELKKDLHPFYYGLQSHPELLTKDFYPSLPFYVFALHASKKYDEYEAYINQRELFKGNKKFYNKEYFLKNLTDIAYS